MHDPAGRDAIILKQALTKDFINLEAVTDVICSRTPSQIQTLKQIYHSTFGTYLEKDIEIQASGDHEKVKSFPHFYQSIKFYLYICKKGYFSSILWPVQKNIMWDVNQV